MPRGPRDGRDGRASRRTARVHADRSAAPCGTSRAVQPACSAVSNRATKGVPKRSAGTQRVTRFRRPDRATRRSRSMPFSNLPPGRGPLLVGRPRSLARGSFHSRRSARGSETAPPAEILVPICRVSEPTSWKTMSRRNITPRQAFSFQFARNVLQGDVNTTLRDSRLVRFAPSTLSGVISGPGAQRDAYHPTLCLRPSA